MTRDEAIDQVLTALHLPALLLRLRASAPVNREDFSAGAWLELAARIVDALPLPLAEHLSGAQRDWLAGNDEFEPCGKICTDVAYAELSLLTHAGIREQLAFGPKITGAVLIGIPCLPDQAPA